MPELPEVETIKRQLESLIVGKTVAGVKVLNQKSFDGDEKELAGKRIIGVDRKGKILILCLKRSDLGRSQGRTLRSDLYIHLKMSGQLQYREEGKGKKEEGKQDKHLRVKIKFSDKSELWFIDQRKFGWMRVRNQISDIRNQISELPKGIDALDIGLTAGKLAKILQSSNRPIKTVLMDQSKIAGIGNIYASEILWEAKINPATKGRTFCAQSGILIQAVRKILNEAIKSGGSTMDDGLYQQVGGESGNYWPRRRVYDREGEPCLRCKTPIKKSIIGQRSAYWCPNCQAA